MSKRALVHSFILLSALLLLFASCGRSGKTSHALTPEPLRYAVNLTCERDEGFSVWTLRDPWDTTQVLHRYILRPTDSPHKTHSPLSCEGESLASLDNCAMMSSSSVIQVYAIMIIISPTFTR